jgi:hypothetical protein
MLFAPLIWRLAMKIEQVSWSEMSVSAAESVHVLRSAQRLFKQDIHCVSFDTWLEAEAAGMAVKRNDLGMPVGEAASLADLPSVDAVLSAEPVVRTVEVLHRLAQEAGSTIPVATMTAGATLQRRFGGDSSAEHVAFVREILLGLTRLYGEAGAGALILLDEEPAENAAPLSEYAALFNLAEYFAMPVFLLSRGTAAPETVRDASAFRANHLASGTASDGVAPLPENGGRFDPGAGWIAMSSWEIDFNTDPNVIQGWRERLARN